MNRVSFVILLALVTSSCSTDKVEVQDPKAPIELVKIHEWEINRSDLLPNPLYAGVLDDMSLVVIDYALFSINHFSESGKLLSTVGREGRGPLEFLAISKAVVKPTGEVAVADVLNSRIHIINVFTQDYEIIEFTGGWGIQLQWVGEKLMIINSPFSSFQNGFGTLSMRYYDLKTRKKTQLYDLKLYLDDEKDPDQISCLFCSIHFDNKLQFYAHPPDTSYRIFRVDPFTDDITLIRRRGPEILPYSKEERAFLTEKSNSFRGSTVPSSPNTQYRAMPRRIFDNNTDHESRLWVSMNALKETHKYFDVFDTNDQYLGYVMFPGLQMRVLQFEQDKILYRKYTDSDIFRASLYQISD